MTPQPTGTVTFLFTDIEGSTALLRELGDVYPDMLETHRRLLRASFADHDGYEVDTQGDAFFVAFSRGEDAARAATEAQRALEQHGWAHGRPLRVRMGIHTSEAHASEGRYVGLGVHRGARISAAGHGGQVLVSQATYDLVAESAGFVFCDLGEHRLKDLGEPQRLYQLVVDGLPTTYPPLRTLENRPTNLRAQVTPFIGRDRELRELAELVRNPEVRLVTLTGPGGTGKTRLALQVAADLVDAFPSGVFFVPLAPIFDPTLVVPAVAEALGINEAGGQSLLGYLGDKRVLFVLDNLEQVLDAAGDLADLLRDAPGVTLLVTSREPLRLAAERVAPVGTLALPAPGRALDVDALLRSPAVELFVSRARAASPTFAPTADTAAAIAAICARLDGLPLALELAAARIVLLSPEELLARLDERLELLTGGARDLPARQQTLRDTIAWSYDLLDAREQDVFARLSVLVGGFTLDSADEICGATVDDLGSLAAKSLIRREGQRLTMLETIREYAGERLEPDGTSVRERHARFFLELAESAYAERIEREAEWADRLAAEHDNLRAAFDWLVDQAPDDALRLAGALGWFWRARSHMGEGRERLDMALKGNAERDAMHARALTSAGSLAGWQGDFERARASLEAAIAAWHELGDEREAALAYEALAWSAFFVGDGATGRAAAEASLELHLRGDDRQLVNRAQLTLCQILVSEGALDEAEALSHEALVLAERQDDKWATHLAHHFLADCALIAEDYDDAEGRYRHALAAAVGLGDRVETAIELQGISMALAGRGEAVRALRLAAAAAATLSSLGVDLTAVAFWRALLEKNHGRAQAELGPEAADTAWAEGRVLTFEEAVDEALGA